MVKRGRDSSIADFTKVPEITFQNVGGLGKAKKILMEDFIVPFVERVRAKHSGKKSIPIPDPEKGIIFYGKPGTGKTYLAEATAGELQQRLGQEVKFISIIGSDIADCYIGETEKKIIEIFKYCKANSPAVLFLDELDSLTPCRNSTGGGSCGQHYNGITHCFLKQLQGINPTETLVIAATNRFATLDSAIIRSGRLETHIPFSSPSSAERENLLEVLVKEKDLHFSSKENFLKDAVAGTDGATPAELKMFVNKVVATLFKWNMAQNRKLKIIAKEDWQTALEQLGSSRFTYRYKAEPLSSVVENATTPVLNSVCKRIKSQLKRIRDSRLEECKMQKLLIEGECQLLNHGLTIGILNECDPQEIPTFKFNCEEIDSDMMGKILEEAATNSKSIIAIENLHSMSIAQEQIFNCFLMDIAVKPNNKSLVITTAIANGQPKRFHQFFEEDERIFNQGTYTQIEEFDDEDDNDSDDEDQSDEEVDSDYESDDEDEDDEAEMEDDDE